MVAIDLRGYGQSSKPLSDEQHTAYSKRIMAEDCVNVMRQLGYDQFYICGHDRGARVAHKLCVDHPERVLKTMFLDIAPTLVMFNKTDLTFAKAYYHWFFLIQPYPFPENLINGNPEGFMAYMVGQRNRSNESIFNPDCLRSYIETMKDPAAVHGMCEDYRASASIDMDQQREDIEKGRKIQCPVMVLWGRKGLIEKCFDAIKEWKEVSASIVVGESLDCGHYIPEEVPEALLSRIQGFFTD